MDINRLIKITRFYNDLFKDKFSIIDELKLTDI
jgi:hypothetical protein